MWVKSDDPESEVRYVQYSGVPRGGGLVGSNTPPPEIPKALQNRVKLDPIVKTVKKCWM